MLGNISNVNLCTFQAVLPASFSLHTRSPKHAATTKVANQIPSLILQGPFTYEALPPDEIRFAPLGRAERITAAELMEDISPASSATKQQPGQSSAESGAGASRAGDQASIWSPALLVYEHRSTKIRL